MKVYVLHYAYYEESEIRGVYTEEAMKKELAQYAEWGRARTEKLISAQKQRIEEFKLRRKALGQEDRKLSERQKQLEAEGAHNARKMLKGERKRLLKQMDQLAHSIRMQECGLREMESMTDQQLAEQEMSRGHLYFEDFYVLGME